MDKPVTINRSIVILMLVVFISSTLVPLTALAQTSAPQAQGVLSVFTDAASCAAGGALGNYLVNLAITGLQRLLFSSWGNKFLSWLNLADKVPILNQNQDNKERILDLIARCTARAVLNGMTNRMIGAARTSGRDGTPSFVTNWKEFLTKAQHRGEDVFRSMLAGTTLCPHYSNELRSIYKTMYQPSLGRTDTRTGNLDPYRLRAQCTMPEGWTIQNYIADFAGNGGWNSLVQLAEPQNNFYGSLLTSLGEVGVQRSQGQVEDIIEAITGAGMTSRRAQNQQNKWLNPGQPSQQVQGYCSNASYQSCTDNTACLALPDYAGIGKVCVIQGQPSQLVQGYCTNDASKTCTDSTFCATLPDYAGVGKICVIQGQPSQQGQGFCSNATDTICTDNTPCLALPDQGTGIVCVIKRNDCKVRGLNGQCVELENIITPGGVLSQSVGAVINQELNWVSSIDEMEELMSNLTDLLLRRILNLSKPDTTEQEGFEGDLYPGFYGDPDLGDLPDPGQNPGGGTQPPTTECTDGIDNDSNGLIDSADAGCSDPGDTDESGGGSGGPPPYIPPASTCGTMTPDSGVRNCSNYIELLPVNQTSAAACSTYCDQQRADACEFDSSTGNCFVEFSSGGCTIQSGFSGWYAAVCSASAPPGTVVELCTETGFNGVCEQFPFSDPFLDDPDNRVKSAWIQDNSASSVRVPAGMTAWLCEFAYYGGSLNNGVCEAFSADDPDLSDNQIGDNAVTSITLFAPEQPNPSCGAIIRISNPYSAFCGFCPYGVSCDVASLTNDCPTGCFYNPNYLYTNQPMCSDGVDNDSDGTADAFGTFNMPPDPECNGNLNGTDEWPP